MSLVLTTISGPMRSGKTDLLIDQLELAQKDGSKVFAFQPIENTREDKIKSEDGRTWPAIKLDYKTSQPVDPLLFHLELDSKKLNVIGIDEIQLFPERNGFHPISDSIEWLASRAGEPGGPRMHIVVSGLRYDSDHNPWGCLQSIESFVECHRWPVVKIALNAWCDRCQVKKSEEWDLNCRPKIILPQLGVPKMATRTFCKVKKTGRVLIGGKEIFEARCLTCWEVGEILKRQS